MHMGRVHGDLLALAVSGERRAAPALAVNHTQPHAVTATRLFPTEESWCNVQLQINSSHQSTLVDSQMVKVVESHTTTYNHCN